MKEIPLSQDKVALVDDEDYEILSKYKWHTQKGGLTFYAVRNMPGTNKKHALLLMHIEIMKMHGQHTEGLVIDHIDHNGLNNTKSNLRCVTQRENLENRRDNTSGYPGVFWHKTKCTWYATVTSEGRRRHLGSFTNPQDAYEARQSFLKRDSFSQEEYQQLLTQQNSLCAICNEPETSQYAGKTRLLAVDYDRVTGKVRGLLCFRCNTNLGTYEAMKEAAEKYLGRDIAKGGQNA